MTSSDLKLDLQSSATNSYLAQWPWYLAMALVIGTVEPLVGTVRHGSEPYVGHWLAYAIGILVAGAVAAPLFGIAAWVVKSEQSNLPHGTSTMIYRPAALPGLVFIGAIMKDFPSSLTEIATYAFLAGFVLLLTVAVITQRKRRQAWSWAFAMSVGAAIALLALLLAGIVSLVCGQRP